MIPVVGQRLDDLSLGSGIIPGRQTEGIKAGRETLADIDPSRAFGND